MDEDEIQWKPKLNRFGSGMDQARIRFESGPILETIRMRHDGKQSGSFTSSLKFGSGMDQVRIRSKSGNNQDETRWEAKGRKAS